MPAMSAKRVSLAKWRTMTPAQQAAKKRALGIPSIRGTGSYRVKSGNSYRPRPRRVKGRGDYKVKTYSYDKPGPFGKVGRSLGRAAGSYFGGPVGSVIGEKLGGLAHYVGKIFGSGDYVTGPSVRQNSILSPQVPSFSSGGATIRVRHQEYLGDVFTSATPNTFSIDSYSINPGLAALFPWLSLVCQGTFQQYKLNGMVIYFKSMSGDLVSSDNTALGTVTMCTDYDSADNAFTSKQQMENTEFGASCKPSQNMIHAIECAPQLTSVSEKYVRAYSNPSGTDIRLYDMGKFYIATQGFQGSNVNIGELWVSYDVTFIKSIQQPPLFGAPVARYTLNSVANSQPLGTVAPTVQMDQIGLSFSGGDTIIFPDTIQIGSVYEVFWSIEGASTLAVDDAGITTAGGFSSYYADAMFHPSPTDTGTDYKTAQKGITAKFKYQSQVAGVSPSITITHGQNPSGITYAILSVSQVSGLTLKDSTYPEISLKSPEAPEYTIVEEQKQPVRVRRTQR